MSKRKDGQARGKYTLEFKMEAVRLVKGGQAVPVTAKILGVSTCFWRPSWSALLPVGYSSSSRLRRRWTSDWGGRWRWPVLITCCTATTGESSRPISATAHVQFA